MNNQNKSIQTILLGRGIEINQGQGIYSGKCGTIVNVYIAAAGDPVSYSVLLADGKLLELYATQFRVLP